MAEPFIGEIRMFAGTFAPRGWAFCSGQLLAISQNDALFSLFGTTYGGDGRTTFGLPEARGRVAIHQGTGPGLSPRALGSKGGVEKVAVNTNQLPVHTHLPFRASQTPADTRDPVGATTTLANVAAGDVYNDAGDAIPVAMNPDAITSIGGGGQHTNIQPFLGINCIVALFGIFPARP